MKHLITFTQETVTFDPLRETQEDKFLLVDFQTRENYNHHKKQSFRALYYMINKLYSKSNELSGIYDTIFSNEKIPDNCPELVAPLIEEPSCVMMCRFFDMFKNVLKCGVEFYSKYNANYYSCHNYSSENLLLAVKARDYFVNNKPCRFIGFESVGTKNDIVFDVKILDFMIKNPPE